MFDVSRREDGTVALSGRFHAGHSDKMRAVMETVTTSCEVDFGELDYISSAGLGVLLATQKRLGARQDGLTLINLNPHIREVFRIAGFDNIFKIV